MSKRFDAEAIVKKMLDATLSDAQDKAKFVRCKEHGQAATISLGGPEGKTLKIGACCEAFASEVRRAISRK